MTNNKKQPGPKGFILVDLVDRGNIVEIPLASNKAWLTLFYALPEELVSKAKAYSKIMNNINYQPAKITAVAFGLALELPWELFTELVSSAGYAMTRTSKFDTVIEFFVKHEKYSIEEVNSVLNELDPELPLIDL